MTQRSPAFYPTVALLSLLVACSYNPKVDLGPPGSTHHTILAGSADIADWSNEWSAEIRRKYPNAVIVFSHGENVGGLWMTIPTIGNPISVALMVQQVRDIHPMRRIVLLICNPGRAKLSAPGVTYAPDSVWVIPDSRVPEFPRFLRQMHSPGFVGSVDQFIENPN